MKRVVVSQILHEEEETFLSDAKVKTGENPDAGPE